MKYTLTVERGDSLPCRKRRGREALMEAGVVETRFRKSKADQRMMGTVLGKDEKRG